jgi:hypothetical protein
MSKAVEATRAELSAGELRELAAKTGDGDVVRRLLAIALILEGHSREDAVQPDGSPDAARLGAPAITMKGCLL